jgi:hypothetical protein
VPIESTREPLLEDASKIPEPAQASTNGAANSEDEDDVPEEEKPWYVPERASRRRSND